jgi:hypothetical protein
VEEPEVAFRYFDRCNYIQIDEKPVMESLGYINAESGPLLIVDGALASVWTGIEGSDYKRACALFDGNPKLDGCEIAVGVGRGIVWEMHGAGTSEVFRDSKSTIVIVRPWLCDPKNRDALMSLAEQPLNQPVLIGNLSVESATIAIFWAAEKGKGSSLRLERRSRDRPRKCPSTALV